MLKDYELAIEKVVQNLVDELGVELTGIMLGGSVAAGTPLKHSDIDIFGIVRGSWHQRRSFAVEGCSIELILRPAHLIREDFQDTEMPATLFIFANGRILHDSEDTVASLAREAQKIIAAGPPAVTMKDRVKLRVGLVELLKDAEDLLDIDEASATYVLLETLRTALEGYYKIQRWWPVKPKYQLRDLQKHQPEIATMARSALNPACTLDERFQAVSHLIDKVLEPVGGRLESWSSPVERLDDPGHEAARQPAEVKSPPQTTV